MNTSSRSDIFTRREIADYMLYETIDARYEQCHVTDLRFLDPCCGMGALLFPILKRIVEDVCSGYCAWNDIRLELVITAIDINPNYIDSLKEQTIVFLKANNCPVERAKYLVNKWFLVNDFLKYDTTVQFDVILGNPPYIRYDNLSQLQQAEYSCRYKTFTGRSDIYIPFFEHALDMLAPRGCLCYICTNRFTKSSYGKRLRNLIIRNHHVRLYLNLEHTQPFESDVSAYPAIFVIDNDMNKPTFAATINDISEETLATLHTNSSLGLSHLNRFDSWFVNGESWLFTDMRNKREIEGLSSFLTIGELKEELCLGIGVATGADDIFVHRGRPSSVDNKYLLPLAISKDIRSGTVQWSEHYLISPYNPETNQLYNLEETSDLKKYFEKHKSILSKRHCAQKTSSQWYRTIDKVSYPLLHKKKILIPDIQTGGCVALDETGAYYPHHNVYWLTSDTWNLFALCVLLRSEFVTSQVRMYSSQLRGGSLRYQAQVLRKVRIPRYSQLSEEQVCQLVRLYHEKDTSIVDEVVNQIISTVKSNVSHQTLSYQPFKQLELFG